MTKTRGTDGKLYTKEEAEKVIPFGDYCYTIEGEDGAGRNHRLICKYCPFHTYRKGKPRQLDGYCRLLKRGDWQGDGVGLLWDGVKSCGINEPDPNSENYSPCSCPVCKKQEDK